MNPIYVDATFKGSKGKKKVKARVNMKADYSSIPKNVAEAIGLEVTTFDIQPTGGKVHQIQAGAPVIGIGDRSAVHTVLINTIDEAVIGWITLNLLGFKVYPRKGIIKPIYPWSLRV